MMQVEFWERVAGMIASLRRRVEQLERREGAAVYSGSGSPEGVLAAPVGSIYLRTDGGAGTTLYVKESGSGSTGWVAK